MSLLISFVSDTYTRVYEKRNIATFTEMAELIHDLEMLLPTCRCKKPSTKQYLSFAKEVNSENFVNDISIGIGQKVTMMGQNLDKKIEKGLKNVKSTQISM